MARKVRHSALESRSARLQLKIRRRPYSGPSLARGIALMYRRNKTNGTWVLKASDGHGAYWTKGFALADDFEDADGKNVLTFYQAQDAGEEAGPRRGRQRRHRADHCRWRAQGLQARSGSAQRQSLQRRASAPAPHQRADCRSPWHCSPPPSSRNGATACSARWRRQRSIGFAAACAPPWNWHDSTMSGSRTGRRGKSDLPACRTRRTRAT